jgi:mRNA interferase RelE/StbE
MADRQLTRLSSSVRSRVIQPFDELAIAPFDPRLSKPLTGLHGMRSSRVGDWRIIFEVGPLDDPAWEGAIDILRIEPRGRVYRRL